MLGELEPNLEEPYTTWKQAPTPENNRNILATLQPTIEGAIKTHVGKSNPLLLSRARGMTLEGLHSYDPMRGKLQTHLYNHLQGLKRVNRQQTTILHVPERVALDRYNLDSATQELAHTTGREPTDAELANHTGFSLKRIGRVRSYKPGVAEGTMESATLGEGAYGAVQPQPHQHTTWAKIVYDDLGPRDQAIMEHSLGLHGRKRLSNQDVARKLNLSPGAISQGKLRIQKLLDEEHNLAGLL